MLCMHNKEALQSTPKLSDELVPFFHLGYRPFVEACVDAGEKDEALKYIPKLSDPRERAEVTTIHHKNMRLVYSFQLLNV